MAITHSIPYKTLLYGSNRVHPTQGTEYGSNTVHPLQMVSYKILTNVANCFNF